MLLSSSGGQRFFLGDTWRDVYRSDMFSLNVARIEEEEDTSSSEQANRNKEMTRRDIDGVAVTDSDSEESNAAT